MSNSLKILLVEDSHADYLLIERELKKRWPRLAIHLAENAEEAEAALAVDRWDVVVSDFHLPGRSFDTLLPTLLSRLPDIPVIVISASIGEEQAVELLKAGVRDLVLKERPARLVPAIERCMRDLARLRDSNERLQETEAIAHLGSWDLDMESGRLKWSDEVYRIFGLQPRAFGASYEAFLACVHPDDRQAVDEAYRRSLLDGLPGYQIEHRIVRKDTGEVRVVHEKCRHVRNAAGRVARSVGMVHDITERRRAEDILLEQANDKSFHDLVGASMDAVLLTAPDGRILMANPAACIMFGRSEEEICRLGRSAIMDPTDPRVAAALEERNRRGHFIGELTFVRADGGRFPGEVSTAIFLDRCGELRTSMSIRDVTERKRVEEDLRAKKEEIEQLMDVAPVAVWIARDPQCMTITGNRAANENYEAAEGENVSASSCPQVRRFTAPDGRELAAGELPMQVAASTNTEVRNAEVHMQLPSGRRIALLGNASPLRDERGEVRGCIGAFIDITESRHAYEESVRLNRELEQHVAERTAQLDRVNETLHHVNAELEQRIRDLSAAKAAADRANAAKSSFLAAASHDLRQPLSALMIYTGMLERATQAPDGKLVASMKQCVSALSQLLGDLLDLSKLDAGVIVPQPSDFAVDDLLIGTFASFEPEAKRKGLSLRVGGAGLFGRTDPVLFQRIVSNLVANAIQYTERGGVLVACRRKAGRTWLEVWDTGIGIPADKTSEVFEEFRQLGNQERNPEKGSGIGLAIVAKTAALLGLEVRVHSRVDKGSVFAVELPLGLPVPPKVPHRGKCRPLRIALVEDNVEVAQALSYSLSSVGHEVAISSSGPEMLALLGDRRPDIVISDYRLAGGETGADVITSARAAFGQDLAAMIITGDTDPAVMRSIAAEGICLQHKPLDLGRLEAAISELTG